MRAKEVKGGTLLEVYVKPSSKRDAVLVHDEVQIETRDPPERGKANASSIKLLAKALGVPPSHIILIRGSTERSKIFLIRGVDLDYLDKKLHETSLQCKN